MLNTEELQTPMMTSLKQHWHTILDLSNSSNLKMHKKIAPLPDCADALNPALYIQQTQDHCSWYLKVPGVREPWLFLGMPSGLQELLW